MPPLPELPMLEDQPHVRPILPSAMVDKIQRLANRTFGLEIRQGKEYLLGARVLRQARKLGLDRPEDYIERLEADSTGQLLTGLIDALTTNFTSFWREPAHFDLLRQDMVRHRDSGNVVDPYPVWCAASSSGEEPYTLAMMACEAFGAEAARRVHVLATDISTRMIEEASRGVYRLDRLEPLPPDYLARYFLKGHNASDGFCKVKPELRAMVTFERVNLVGTFGVKGPFAAIFCRNVMIYFDSPTRNTVVLQLLARLRPGGLLFVGHAESVTDEDLEYVRPAVYRLRTTRRGAEQGARG